jgi:Trk K+ transport system NAD-binding subunit
MRRRGLPFRLRRSTRRLLLLLASLPAAVAVLGLVYMLGMTYLEGSPRSFLASVEWASETLTTTGYGGDAHWRHPLMTMFVIAVQFTGLFLVFLIFPVYVLPYFEERFEARLPRSLPAMDGRLLFHRYGRAVDSLIEELRRLGTPFVILEQDPELGRRLHDRGYPVVVGNLEEDAGMLRGIDRASALVTDADDHADSTFIMMAREQGFSGPIYAFAENPLHRAPMLKVGATAVYTPSHVLAGALAARASPRISPPAEGLDALDEHLGIAEYRVHPDSPLAGRTLGELHLRERLGVNLVGQWHGGVFAPARGPETRIAPGAILLVIGARDNLTRVEELAAPLRTLGPIVVAGYGTVGHKVVQMLRDAGETAIVIDEQAQPDVDVVGNVLEQTTLEQAQVRTARALVLALSNDSAGVLATAVIRDHAPQIRLIARVNRAASVRRLYQAGADFVLSMGQVAGQLLAHQLLGQSALGVEQRLRCLRLTPGNLAGSHPWKSGVRERSGAVVVAVERTAGPMLDLAADFRLRPDDVVVVCGTLASLDLYQREFKAEAWRGATGRFAVAPAPSAAAGTGGQAARETEPTDLDA